ncbi:MAG: YidC/Oxa1 family membrane protein insertase [Bacillota bacterium]
MIAKPLGMLLNFLYGILGNYGLSIIVFTVIVKLILLPLAIQQVRQTKQMAELQPKIKELQEKYKNDQETLNKKTMELWKEHKANPVGGCLPLLIQMPIIFGLFTLLREPVKYIADPNFSKAVNESFLWIPNLSQPDPSLIPNMPFSLSISILAILAAVTTYFSMSTATTGSPQQNQQMKTMNTVFPFLIFYWAGSFPAGLSLYWVVSNVFQMVQQYVMSKSNITAKPKEELK